MTDYRELAEQFLNNLFRFRSHQQQKIVDGTMQGEPFALLYILKSGRIVLPSEISQKMNISTARVAAMLNNLENKGYITRTTDSGDRRRTLVDLTPAGIALAEGLEQQNIDLTARMLALLGGHDAVELVRIMGRLPDLLAEVLDG